MAIADARRSTSSKTDVAVENFLAGAVVML
jgi:hypothetical protein